MQLSISRPTWKTRRGNCMIRRTFWSHYTTTGHGKAGLTHGRASNGSLEESFTRLTGNAHHREGEPISLLLDVAFGVGRYFPWEFWCQWTFKWIQPKMKRIYSSNSRPVGRPWLPYRLFSIFNRDGPVISGDTCHNWHEYWENPHDGVNIYALPLLKRYPHKRQSLPDAGLKSSTKEL